MATWTNVQATCNAVFDKSIPTSNIMLGTDSYEMNSAGRISRWWWIKRKVEVQEVQSVKMMIDMNSRVDTNQQHHTGNCLPRKELLVITDHNFVMMMENLM